MVTEQDVYFRVPFYSHAIACFTVNSGNKWNPLLHVITRDADGHSA